MIKELLRIANILDEKGFLKEANDLDEIIKAFASKSKYTKKQLDTFDTNGNGIPFEDEDWDAMSEEDEESSACDKGH
tara:strand:- start:7322 stop:7552 length:231 start_codon:yes stop_codon:yes gene_type:complete